MIEMGINKTALRTGIGCLVLSAAILGFASPSSAKTVKKTEESKKKVTLAKETELHVENAKGTTKIVGKSQGKIISIKTVKVAKASSDEEAQAAIDDLTFEIEKSGKVISIVTHYPDKTEKRKGVLGLFYRFKQIVAMNYYIEIPSFMDVKVDSKSGDVSIVMIKGSARVSCASGDVDLEQIGGDAAIDLSSGDIHAKDVDGSVKVATASGDVHCTSIGGDLGVETASGDLEISDVKGNASISVVSGDLVLKNCKGSVEAESSSGNLELLGVEGCLSASASSGDINAVINPDAKKVFNLSTASGDVGLEYLTPSKYGFLLEISTGSGSISGDMTIKMQNVSRRHLKGVVGSGIAQVKIMTASGDVDVSQARSKHK
jgi:hypothetical protein